MSNRKEFEGPPQSFWLDSTDSKQYPELSEEISAEVAIIGGGMAGILCAYYLHLEGLDVVVLEADRIVQGTTAHTTAKITSQHGLIYDKIYHQMGPEQALQYAEANEFAIGEIKRIAESNHIECDFIAQSAYVYTQQDKNVEKIEKEVKAADALGINASYTSEIPFPIPIKAAVCFTGQAQFHPRRFLLPLAKKIHPKVRIFENTRVIALEQTTPFKLTTATGKKVVAKQVIIASHYPFYNKHSMYYSRLYSERAYIIAIKTKEKYPGGMYINAEDPSRSLRQQKYHSSELVLVAGENHKTGQGKDLFRHYEALAEFAERVFDVEDILYRWSTQDCMTLDGIPYIGQYASDTPGLYIATGFEKWGMTKSIVSAILIKDLIIKGDSPWAAVFNPSRKNILPSVKNFVVENFDVAKHLIEGKITALPDHVEVNRNEGKVVEVNGKRAGAFRDEEGHLHLVNTTCTHMGCELNWNDTEYSWDCPCHGSRFTHQGKIIEGPSVHPLSSDHDVNPLKKIIKDDF